tara:strand:+ start:1161 stop:1472 length:312 start_codon:yes stop_codon:yes gene_type:complete
VAEIKTPLTAAMKRRAAEALVSVSQWDITLDEEGAEVSAETRADFLRRYTPREMRAIILQTGGSEAFRAELKSEGWFETPDGPEFRASSNTPLKLTKPASGSR